MHVHEIVSQQSKKEDKKEPLTSVQRSQYAVMGSSSRGLTWIPVRAHSSVVMTALIYLYIGNFDYFLKLVMRIMKSFSYCVAISFEKTNIKRF